jgi:glucosamine--fructose-6-phosphate aminotransferase (isomerizing)
MCGIVGYIGKKEAVPFLIERLDDLSYRGYDSAGIAVLNDGGIEVRKEPGKIKVLREALSKSALEGTIGIGHTRWATHGQPNKINAHPHFDCTGRIAVVQNGIVENYLTLKNELIAGGHEFVSQTDTEIIPHLIEEYYDGDLLDATRKAVRRLEGAFALVIISADEERLVAVRYNAPLIVGVGGGENYVASDITALLKDTNKVYVLENGDIVSVENNHIKISSFFDGDQPTNRRLTIVGWDAADVSKGEYEHYMLKEIHEQPSSIEKTLEGRLTEDGEVLLRTTELPGELIRRTSDVHIVACGTAYHAGCYGKYLLERFLNIPVTVDIASEFRYREPVMDSSSLVILVSQSGETADTIASLQAAKEKGATTLGIVNVRGSTIARDADAVLHTKAGPEIAVASTKAFTAQMTAFLLIALKMADERGVQIPYPRDELVAGLRNLPEYAQTTIDETTPVVRELAKIIAKHEHCYFLGRNIDEPISREGALKLKEISYVHAEAYPAGELKHGTIALIDEGTPVVAVMTQEGVFEKMVSNIQEVIARQARVSVVTNRIDGLDEMASEIIMVPDVTEILAPVLAVIPLQLLAYYTALELGCDIDQPRNLAKSVTVE